MADTTTPESVGRDHWHHFRVGRDGESRCHYCGMTLEEFEETKRLQETHGQTTPPATA